MNRKCAWRCAWTRSTRAAFPIGVYRNGERLSPILLDSRFLLGPEAGHLNVTGTSGLAAKTSAIMFLIQAAFQKLSAEKDGGGAVV
jgi:hypothetical protein